MAEEKLDQEKDELTEAGSDSSTQEPGIDAELNSTGGPQDRAGVDLLSDDELIPTGDPLAATAHDDVPSAARMEQMQAELERARDAVLRAQAEAQNTLRRAEQDVEKARKFALERFSSELLPVVDNLERSLEAASIDESALKSIADGVELTLKSFTDALRKFHIEAVDPAGEPFDPKLHQAMSMIENPDAEPNTVLAVMQKGYTLNGRLLRPAMVMVSKAPSA